jgi:predicted RNA-binding protein with PIN domain
MEPLPAGSGLVFDTHLPENILDLNWQRLILTHLYEKAHRGTLTGALLTDTKMVLVAGRAHQKHTEGGDFREATYRAIRQGLMKAGCTLLEPYYRFRLELPASLVGRAMTDLQNRHADFEMESSTEEVATLVGRGPVSTLHGYIREVIAYTRGLGRMTCVSDGYEPCHNTEEVAAAVGYDPEADLENTPHSVFCSHGAGVVIPWQEVDAHKHLEANVSRPVVDGSTEDTLSVMPRPASLKKRYALSDEELEAIMLREFGPIKRRRYTEPKRIADIPAKRQKPKPQKPARRLVIVDGYNLIFAWEALNEVAKYSLEKARETLMDTLASYAAYTKTELMLVFDAYRVPDGTGSDFERDGMRVVYTKQNQTADAYIERVIHDLGPDYSIRVVTGDYLLQVSAVISGVSRVTTKEFAAEVTRVGSEITEFIRKLSEKRT